MTIEQYDIYIMRVLERAKEAYDLSSSVQELYEDLEEGRFDWGCPRDTDGVPSEYIDESMFTGDCEEFTKEQQQFIRETLRSGEIKCGGLDFDCSTCEGCWAFHHYWLLANIIKDEVFWEV